MKFLLKPLAGLVVLLALALSLPNGSPVSASSSQAYQDYLYQFDLYRKTFSDFQTARAEYLKFQTLTSENTALLKTKTMLSQRATLLRTYLLLLVERINEDQGLTQAERSRFLGLVNAEVAFQDSQKSRVPSIGSLAQATALSGELEAHYPALYATMRTVGSELLRGNIQSTVTNFDQLFSEAKQMAARSATLFPVDKQATINRWITQIADRRGSLQQSLDALAKTDATMLSTLIPSDVDRLVADAGKSAVSGKQQLVQLSSNLGELITSLQYQY